MIIVKAIQKKEESVLGAQLHLCGLTFNPIVIPTKEESVQNRCLTRQHEQRCAISYLTMVVFAISLFLFIL